MPTLDVRMGLGAIPALGIERCRAVIAKMAGGLLWEWNSGFGPSRFAVGDHLANTHTTDTKRFFPLKAFDFGVKVIKLAEKFRHVSTFHWIEFNVQSGQALFQTKGTTRIDVCGTTVES